jgi:hypothetical protein
MKLTALSLLCVLCLPVCVAAQKSLSALPPAHASALRGFLRLRPKLKFLSEGRIDPEYLKFIRKHFGAQFTPFYQQGDFNGDGRQDFAAVLIKDVPPEDMPGLADTHRLRFQLSVVVFNGSRSGRFRPAFVKNTKAPLASFINTTPGKKPGLYFGVFQTDSEGFTINPSGRGYTARQ